MAKVIEKKKEETNEEVKLVKMTKGTITVFRNPNMVEKEIENGWSVVND